MKRQEIREELFRHQDLKFRDFCAPLLRAKLPLIGVRIPVLHKLAKGIDCFPKGKDEYFEEQLLRGLTIVKAKKAPEEILQDLKAFVLEISDWGVCDCVATAAKVMEKNRAFFFPFLKELAETKEEFRVRFAVVSLLFHYLTPEWQKRIFKILQNANTETYYARMGVAWTLQKAFVKFPHETLEFLNDKKLNSEVKKLAVRKIRESQAIDPRLKDLASQTIKK